MVDGSGEVAGEPGADLETVVRQHREGGIALRLGQRLPADTDSFRKIADRISEADEQVGALSSGGKRPDQLSQQLPAACGIAGGDVMARGVGDAPARGDVHPGRRQPGGALVQPRRRPGDAARGGTRGSPLQLPATSSSGWSTPSAR
jgi:hypothetical protein